MRSCLCALFQCWSGRLTCHFLLRAGGFCRCTKHSWGSPPPSTASQGKCELPGPGLGPLWLQLCRSISVGGACPPSGGGAGAAGHRLRSAPRLLGKTPPPCEVDLISTGLGHASRRMWGPGPLAVLRESRASPCAHPSSQPPSPLSH